MIIVSLIVFLGIATVLFLNSFHLPRTFEVGLVRRFRSLTKKKILPTRQFPYFTIPFIEDIIWENAGGEKISVELKSSLVEIKVFSKDNQTIEIKGKLFFQVDPEIAEKFAKLGKGTLDDAIAAVQDELGIIAGTQGADSFIEERGAIKDLINCVLRMAIPPHRTPEKFNATDEDVKAENRLKFYREHLKEIKELVKKEKEEKEDKATIEKRFGIDVETFDLVGVTFSEKITEAREREAEVVRQMKAANRKKTQTLEIMNALIGKGVAPEAALDAAQTMVGDAKKQVISVRGSRNSLVEAAAVHRAAGGER